MINISDINNIYIIANNKNISPELFKTIKYNDLVAVCNHDQWCDVFKNHDYKIIFVRYAESIDSWWGYNKLNPENYKYVIFINGTNKISSYLHIKNRLIIDNDNDIELYKKLKYPTNKWFSTGLIAYLFMKKNFPNKNIVLIGFTFEMSNEWHAGIYEKQYFLDNNVSILT